MPTYGVGGQQQTTTIPQERMIQQPAGMGAAGVIRGADQQQQGYLSRHRRDIQERPVEVGGGRLQQGYGMAGQQMTVPSQQQQQHYSQPQPQMVHAQPPQQQLQRQVHQSGMVGGAERFQDEYRPVTSHQMSTSYQQPQQLQYQQPQQQYQSRQAGEGERVSSKWDVPSQPMPTSLLHQLRADQLREQQQQPPQQPQQQYSTRQMEMTRDRDRVQEFGGPADGYRAVVPQQQPANGMVSVS